MNGGRKDPDLESERVRGKAWRDRIRARALDHLGGKCVRCGFDDVRALQIDHVNGGGRRLMTEKGAGYHYRDVLTHLPGVKYQLLCANCNWIKKYEQNENSYGETSLRHKPLKVSLTAKARVLKSYTTALKKFQDSHQ